MPLDRARFRGCLLGLAAGDALGTTLEFKSPGSFALLTDMVGGGPFRLQPGQWTDDTSLALCLAESLIAKDGFDPVHQLETYCRWWKHGHLSATGRCFDIGNTTRAALDSFLRKPRPYPGDTDDFAAGNGSIMRLAPVPMRWANDPAEAVRLSGESSRTTHGNHRCIDACRYLGGLTVAALQGGDQDHILNNDFDPLIASWLRKPLTPLVAEVAGGSFKRKRPPEIAGTGYVIKSLEAALWAFHTTDTFRDGALAAVNLGDDADTTGAVYGQVAGAFYGEDAIPVEWRAKLAMRDVIERFADQLFERAG